ncbi:MAG: peptide-methionine (S)-S-oxide reductase [Henriciella sp.]|jgi:peptide-methionine (S)-S-oxide reductase|uniref:peptide-methionine (S)-S-oxide reductase MsrA n=1 Tax=Henriciella sp. TaxID=1968823 RepID=UPI000C116391|nr:peptide-methionine (S)-S-oxide reductase MsrA [Henriciella sp.]MAN75053.1 peptide-methionine (S)-S-oxide reductase [Henriciella sp.]MBK76847.1 peptide-methionine (S)-S-oxide reductase [Henriciella sp.]PHR71662.1 MAG: peptide-methionine (S)-S-oxide reductase [Henriciella sp.]|tara:strand:- start:10975 stop:11643 length:669 start_codon:yes stop_codon:yes gene_type:complete
MKLSQSTLVAIAAGTIAAGSAFVWSAMADEGRDAPPPSTNVESAIFAGGCFWCTEADFDKVDGVISTVSGYTGGTVENPTYRQVTSGDTGHYEAVEVTYDPAKVTYDELVDYYFHTIDPTDERGQFCDKGSSYRSAVFVETGDQREAVEAEIEEIEESGVLPGPVVTSVLDESTFWKAEDYHQNYYKTTPVKYRFYRQGCGRDARLKELWGDEAMHLPDSDS